jgi:hypothetical protein
MASATSIQRVWNYIELHWNFNVIDEILINGIQPEWVNVSVIGDSNFSCAIINNYLVILTYDVFYVLKEGEDDPKILKNHFDNIVFNSEVCYYIKKRILNLEDNKVRVIKTIYLLEWLLTEKPDYDRRLQNVFNNYNEHIKFLEEKCQKLSTYPKPITFSSGAEGNIDSCGHIYINDNDLDITINFGISGAPTSPIGHLCPHGKYTAILERYTDKLKLNIFEFKSKLVTRYGIVNYEEIIEDQKLIVSIDIIPCKYHKPPMKWIDSETILIYGFNPILLNVVIGKTIDLKPHAQTKEEILMSKEVFVVDESFISIELVQKFTRYLKIRHISKRLTQPQMDILDRIYSFVK